MAPCGNEHPLECAQVTSEVAHVTHVDRISFSSQHGRGHVLAADGVLDSLLGVFREQVARYGLSMEDAQQAVENAIGREDVDTAWLGLERDPGNVRFTCDFRSDLGALERVFV